MSETDHSALQDALFAVIRAEIDDSLTFVTGCRQLPRSQRHPRLEPAVRDYVANQVAWTVVELLDGGIDEIRAQIGRDAMTGCCARDGIDCPACMTGHCHECLECIHGPSHDDSARDDEDDACYDVNEAM